MATPRRRRRKRRTQDDAAGEIHSQPSARVQTVWSPAQVRACERTADSGYLLSAADLCDNLLADERIREALEVRIGGLLSLEMDFERGTGRSAARALRHLDKDQDWWHAFPEEELQQLITWGRLLGVSIGELVWGQRDGRAVPRLKFWHPRHLRYDWTTRRWILKTEDGEQTVEPGDGKWVIYCPYGNYRPWSMGLWRGLARWWLLKAYAISDWGRHSEKAARSVITAPEQVTGEVRKQLADDIQAAGQDATISLPAGFDLKLVEVSSNTERIYKGQIEAANSGIDIGIRGQNLTTEVQGGSFAAASVHLKVENRLIRSDDTTVSTTLREQALSWYAEFNWADPEAAPWPTRNTEPPEDLQQKAGVLSTVADGVSKLKTAGFKVTPEWLKEEFGVEVQEVEVEDPEPDPSEGSGGDTGGDPKPDDQSAGQRNHRVPVRTLSGVRLASGGFVNAQLYGDELADNAADGTAGELEGFVERLIAVIDAAAPAEGEAPDYEALRTSITEAFRDEVTPAALAELVEHALTLGNLAGQLGVREDL